MEAPTTAAAAKQLVGRRVEKDFGPGFGLFGGLVKRVDANVPDSNGTVWPFLFYVVYDDNDEEHLTWEELNAILQPEQPQQPQQQQLKRPRPSSSLEAGERPAAEPQRQRGTKRIKQEPGTEHAAAAAAATPAAFAAAVSPRSTKRRRKQLAPQHHQPYEDDEENSAASTVPQPDDGTVQEAAGGNAKHHITGCDERRRKCAAATQEAMQEDEEEAADQGSPSDHAAVASPDDLMATQHDRSSIAVRKKGYAGHLHRIHLQNFICHENFEMVFGTHVNFISGTNGSGKSAVLQGLQCCLGATAKSTGRAPSLEHFIRTGTDEAKVQVTLWNTGEDAFQPSVFGETITIERRISKRGGTAWKVYDQRMKAVLGANRNLINAILDQFSINAANPLAVMTQDTSRNFLGGGTADKRKYDLFMEATMLADFRARLSTADMHVSQMKAGLKTVREEYMERKCLLKQLIDKLQKLKDADQLLSQRGNLEQAVLWTGVQERAGVLTNIQQLLQVSLPNKRAPFARELARLQGLLELLAQEEKQKVARQLEIHDNNQAFAEEMQKLADSAKSARRALQVLKRQQQEQAREVAEAQGRLDAMVQAQMESNDDAKRQLAQRLAHNQAQAAQATQRREQLAQEVTAQQGELQDAEHRVQQLEADRPAIISRLNGLRREIDNMQVEKRTIYASAKDSLQLFGGATTTALVAAVKGNLQRFHRPPLGPIGAHLALDDTKWAKPVEAALKAHMHKWIVHDRHDEQQLRNLARMHRADLTVLIYSFDTPPYHVGPDKRPQRQYTLLQDVLRLKDVQPSLQHVLWNQLLDRANIANVVLEETSEAAGDVMYNHKDPNVSAAYDIDAMRYAAIGAARSTVMISNMSHVRPRLGADTAANLRELDRLIGEAEAKSQAEQQQLADLDAQLQAAKATVEQLKDQLRAKAKHRGTIESTLRQLSTQAQDIAAEQAEGDVEDVACMIQSLQQELTTSQLKLDRIEGELQEATQADFRARTLHQQKVAEAQLAAEEIGAVNDAVVRIAEDKAGAEAAAKKLSASLASLAAETARLEQLKVSTEAELAQCRADAEAICSEEEGSRAVEAVRAVLTERVAAQLERQLERQRRAGDAEANISEEQRQAAIAAEVARRMSPEGLLAELDKVDKAIRSVEGEAGGSREDLELQRSKLQAEVSTRGIGLQNLTSTKDSLVEFLRVRKQAFYELFQSMSRGVANKFFKYMAQRNHRGKIEIDEDACELKLLVGVNAMAAAANEKVVVKDLKQLSGGERSYTTVSFVLALGEWTESPFRAMDEFDVYMDAINRRIATETLLKFAIDNDHLQFLFLTPQDLQAVADAKQHLAKELNKEIPAEFVRVVQMWPARANATRA